jgi:glyoxylase-like metal-dependent hydrolase (beta-lactamase superfamily II)
MLRRKYLFPNVIELNYQAGRRLGVNVYLVEDGGEFVLIDVGYDDAVEEILDLIRRMDFSLSACKLLIATHADVDHTQGLRRASEALRAPVAAHPFAAQAIETADPEITFSRIKAQDINLEMPKVKVERRLDEGDVIEVGGIRIVVWSTPGHAKGQLAFKMGKLLFVGDNIYKDGSVGVIDAHHGSNLPDFIRSLERIRDDDSEFWLPSHGPVFRRDPALIQATIDRLTQYQHLADFGTCAVDWPLLEEWERDVASGRMPSFSPDAAAKGAAEKKSGPAGARLPGALS